MTIVPNPAKELSPDWLTSLQSLLATVVIAVFVITYVVQAFQIPSESMENTLLIGDYLLVDKLCYGGGNLADYIIPYRTIHRGDIIVFHYPVNPSQHFVKRVVGVPGDRIHLVNRRVFVNGVPLAEPYVRYIKPERNFFRDDFPGLMCSTLASMPIGGCKCPSWSKMDNSSCRKATTLPWEITATTAPTAAIGALCRART